MPGSYWQTGVMIYIFTFLATVFTVLGFVRHAASECVQARCDVQPDQEYHLPFQPITVQAVIVSQNESAATSTRNMSDTEYRIVSRFKWIVVGEENLDKEGLKATYNFSSEGDRTIHLVINSDTTGCKDLTVSCNLYIYKPESVCKPPIELSGDVPLKNSSHPPLKPFGYTVNDVFDVYCSPAYDLIFVPGGGAGGGSQLKCIRGGSPSTWAGPTCVERGVSITGGPINESVIDQEQQPGSGLHLHAVNAANVPQPQPTPESSFVSKDLLHELEGDLNEMAEFTAPPSVPRLYRPTSSSATRRKPTRTPAVGWAGSDVIDSQAQARPNLPVPASSNVLPAVKSDAERRCQYPVPSHRLTAVDPSSRNRPTLGDSSFPLNDVLRIPMQCRGRRFDEEREPSSSSDIDWIRNVPWKCRELTPNRVKFQHLEPDIDGSCTHTEKLQCEAPVVNHGEFQCEESSNCNKSRGFYPLHSQIYYTCYNHYRLRLQGYSSSPTESQYRRTCQVVGNWGSNWRSGESIAQWIPSLDCVPEDVKPELPATNEKPPLENQTPSSFDGLTLTVIVAFGCGFIGILLIILIGIMIYKMCRQKRLAGGHPAWQTMIDEEPCPLAAAGGLGVDVDGSRPGGGNGGQGSLDSITEHDSMAVLAYANRLNQFGHVSLPSYDDALLETRRLVRDDRAKQNNHAHAPLPAPRGAQIHGRHPTNGGMRAVLPRISAGLRRQLDQYSNGSRTSVVDHHSRRTHHQHPHQQHSPNSVGSGGRHRSSGDYFYPAPVPVAPPYPATVPAHQLDGVSRVSSRSGGRSVGGGPGDIGQYGSQTGLYSSRDTMNISDGYNMSSDGTSMGTNNMDAGTIDTSSVTIETYSCSSNPSLALSARAAAGSIASAESEAVPLLDNPRRHDRDSGSRSTEPE